MSYGTGAYGTQMYAGGAMSAAGGGPGGGAEPEPEEHVIRAGFIHSGSREFLMVAAFVLGVLAFRSALEPGVMTSGCDRRLAERRSTRTGRSHG